MANHLQPPPPQGYKATDIAVIGMACRFPGASDYRQFWNNLVSGVDSVTLIPGERWDWRTYWGDPQTEANKTNSKWGGFIADIDKFDPIFFAMSPKEANYLDPQHRILLQAVWHAIEDAGYRAADLSGQSIGVYIGVSKNDYAELMRSRQEEIVSFVSTGTVHSILANRISYLLNLRGKSETVDTACSSSLVALHNAIRDIQLGDCQAALVGGVNALLTPTMYISHAKSGMLSPDGRCKTFDATANGYVRGEGVGVIFIKALPQALADQDHIIGVIKGSAVNHGGRANSLTAPNVKAQAEVIQAALHNAHLSPETISYLEAHGTATPLGDPIEIKGLTNAWQSSVADQDKPYCGLGSVKTNIGHLESAAGMAGLIKLLLSLHHRQLPPLLHFSRLNPYIELENTPFYIVDQLTPWQPLDNAGQTLPRRAGLSSFGMGGVNAHVIVQEAPALTRPITAAAPQGPMLIPLSAKSATALTNYAQALDDFLADAGRRYRLADIAFTLQSGREAMSHRVVLLAADLAELQALLQEFLAQRPHAHLLHGQALSPTATVTVAVPVAATVGEMPPLREIAAQWVQGGNVDWRALPQAQGYRVPLPVYPFAQRRCWFADAEPAPPAQPETATAAIPANHHDSAAAEATDRAVAPYNYHLHASDYFIRDHVVRGTRLLPGVAYFELLRAWGAAHQQPVHGLTDVYWPAPLAVDESVEVQIVATGDRLAVQQGQVTCMTGKLAAHAPPPPLDLTAMHTRCPQTIAGAQLYQYFADNGLAYGATLRVIERCHYSDDELFCRLVQSPTLPAACPLFEPSLLDGVLQAVVALHILGDIDYTVQTLPFHLGAFYLYQPLPSSGYAHVYKTSAGRDPRTLTFAMRLYDEQDQIVAVFEAFRKRPVAGTQRSLALPPTPVDLHTYTSTWQSQPLTMHREALRTCLLFDHTEALCTQLQPILRAERLLLILPGDTFAQLAPDRYQVNANDPQGLQALFTALAQQQVTLDSMVYGWNFVATAAPASDLHNGIRPLLLLTQALIAYKNPDPIRVLYLYQQAQSLSAVLHALPGGIARTLAYENPQITLLTVGVESATPLLLAEIVCAELSHYTHPPLHEVRYQQGVRTVRTIVETAAPWQETTRTQATASLLRPNGCYLIAGGAGGIGQIIARYLAASYQATLILVGRSQPTPAIEQKLAALTALGGQAFYFAADVTDKKAVDDLVAELARRQLTLHGVIHGAGLIDDAYLLHKTAISFRKVLAPKLFGAIHLDEATRSHPLDFFLAFSSIAALMPNQGQGDYAAANSFLDSFMAHRNRLWAAGERPGISLAINWPLWANGGIGVNVIEQEHLWRVFGMKSLGDDEGIAIFAHSLRQPVSTPHAHLVAIEGDKAKIDKHLKVTTHLPVNNPPTALPPTALPPTPAAVEQRLLQLINQVLTQEQPIDPHAILSDVGLTSITFIALADRINQTFACALKPSIFFEYQTVAQLAHYLQAQVNVGLVNPAGALPVTTLIDREHSQPDQGRYRKMLYNDEFFMRDHVVAGQFNVPGACYIEIARQACLLAAPTRQPYRLTNNYWAKQLSSTGAPIQVDVELQAKDGYHEYEISSRAGRDKIIHALGQLYTATPGEVVALDLGRLAPAAIRARCPVVRQPQAIYAQIHAEGLHVGPTFMPMLEIALNEQEALAHLRLPATIAATAQDYALHPTLLTGVLQTALLNNKPQGLGGVQFIPLGIDEIRLIATLPAECYVYTQRHAANGANDAVKKFDAQVATLDGKVVATLQGIALRALAAPQKAASSSHVLPALPVPPVATATPQLQAQAETLLQSLIAEGIGLLPTEIDLQADFEAFGINSVMIIDLNRRLETRFGNLSKTLFFEYKNCRELAQYFCRHHAAALQTLLPEAAPVSPLPSLSDEGAVRRTEAMLVSPLSSPPLVGANLYPQLSLPEVVDGFNVTGISKMPVTFRRSDLRPSDLWVKLSLVGEETVPPPSRERLGGGSPDDIAIIGAAGRYPGARNLGEFWRVLQSGQDCITEIPPERFDYQRYYDKDKDHNLLYARWGGFIDGVDQFDPLFFNISPREAELIDPQERLFLQVVWETLEDAGYTRARIAADSNQVGVFVGALWQPYVELGVAETLQGNVIGPSGLLYSIPNRVSYFFDWTGPSLAIDTACSSSLTALHYACESLRHGECAGAIVGGVNLSLTAGKYLFLSQNGFLAGDGRCRSFGAGGDGYVPGEGVGAVYLKRLADAQRAGDRILAVIKATAVNHGGKTNGYTVPNPNRQQELILAALHKSGVHPRAISYVEAHGTGTALGDPIEITGLQKAFAHFTDERQFCAIGSVKSNIGHLEAAAGIAGLTKILLQLHHQTLAPSLHAERLNPNIDWAASPFVVQRTAAAWPRPQLADQDTRQTPPRYAMISSFGAGGSYAHAIIAEYVDHSAVPMTIAPIMIAPSIARLIPLSAKDEQALQEQARQLLDHLQASPTTPPLADLAYTLQVGREAMRHRVAFLVADLPDLITQLAAYGAQPPQGGAFTGVADSRRAPTELSGFENLTALDTQSIPREQLAQLAQSWVQGVEPDWEQFYGSSKPRRLRLPTYPFRRERYWLPAAPTPLAPANGSAQVATQAHIQPLHPLLHQNSSDLTEQCYHTTFTGTEFFLDDHRIKGTMILPGVAHLEMARAAGELAGKQAVARLEQVVWAQSIAIGDGPKRVKLSLISAAEALLYTVTTDAIADATTDATAETAAAAGQAGAAEAPPIVHSQGKIIYSDRVQSPPPAPLDLSALRLACTATVAGPAYYQGLADFGLELGPRFQSIVRIDYRAGAALAEVQLPAALADQAHHFYLHPVLMDAVFQVTGGLGLLGLQPPTLHIPFELKSVQLYGPIPAHFYAYVTYSRGYEPTAACPTPAAVAKYDALIVDEQGAVKAVFTEYTPRAVSGGAINSTVDLIYSAPIWQTAALLPGLDQPDPAAKRIIVTAGLPDTLTAQLKAALPGVAVAALPQTLVTSAATDDDDPTAQGAAVLAYLQELWRLVQEMIRTPASIRQRLLVLVPATAPAYRFAPFAGFFKSAHLEHANLRGQVIQIEPAPTGLSAALLDQVQHELYADQVDDVEVRYTADGQRQVRQLVELRPAPGNGQSAIALRPRGVYWITGGLGGLGRLFAQHLLQEQADITLILTGRSPLDVAQQTLLAELQTGGRAVVYWPADVSKQADLAALLQMTKARYGALHGIIHSAGLLRDGLLFRKTADDIAAVCTPKILGALQLDAVTQHEPLDFFILFSSIAGLLGNVGQSDYAAANTFLDGFAAHRQRLVDAGRRHGRTLAINWPLWADGGMTVNAATLQRLERQTGTVPLPTADGLHAFDQMRWLGSAQIAVAAGQAAQIRAIFLAQPRSDEPSLSPQPQPPAQVAYQPAAASHAEAWRRVKVQADLQQTLVDLLKLKPQDLSSKRTFHDYGLESLSLTHLANQLNQRYDLALTPTLFFEYNTLDALTAYLLAEHRNALLRAYPAAASTTVPTTVPAVTPAETQQPRQRHTPTPRPTRFHSQPSRWVSSTGATADPMPVAIIGMDGMMPGSPDLATFWQHLIDGRDLISEIPSDRWDWRAFYGDPQREPNKTNARWGGFMAHIDQFDAPFFQLSRREAELMDPQQRLFLQTVWHCLENAGYPPSQLAGSNTGLFVGVSTIDYWELLSTQQIAIEGHTATGVVHSVLANRISYLLDWHGPSEPIDTACSSSLVAIHRAVQALRSGQCTLAVAGGVNALLSPQLFIAFSKAGMLAADGRCKSFDHRANGYARGEGVGAILLKPLAQAEADGDLIYGVIRGSAQNHGGHANSLTAPNPAAQAALLVSAYEQAQLDPSTIGYIEAHGTGTALGDPIEVNGLQKAFATLYESWGQSAPAQPHCGLGSVKSNIGHLEAAAGIAGVIKVLLAMHHQQLPASIHIEQPNPYIDLTGSPFYLVRESQPWDAITDSSGVALPRRAGVSSFGFGGAYAHVVLEEYITSEEPQEAATDGPYLIPLSARDADRLAQVVANFHAYVSRRPDTQADLARIAYTLQVGREAMAERVAFVVADQADLSAKLGQWAAGQAEIPGCYRGDQPQTGTALRRLFSADDLTKLTTDWIADGRWDKLAALWVNGVPIDWDTLYTGPRPRRIALPTYPFAQERYWALQLPQPVRAIGQTTGAVAAQLHPLLHANISDLQRQQFATTLTGQEFFLADHQLQQQLLLPGVAYLEMARAAAALSTHQPVTAFHNVRWSQPLVVGQAPRAVTIGLAPTADQLQFRVESAADGATQALLCSQGQVVVGAAATAPATAIQAVLARCPTTMTGEELYRQLQAVGAVYGPQMQSITAIYTNGHELLAALHLPASLTTTADAFVIHPTMADGALQAALALLLTTVAPAAQAIYVPFAVESVTIYQPTPRRGYAHVRFSPAHTPQANAADFDVDLLDETGTLCLALRTFTARRFGRPAATRKAEKSRPVSEGATPRLDNAALQAQTQRLLQDLLGDILKLAPQAVDAETNFERFGIDSLLQQQVLQRLAQVVGDLSPTLLFEYSTLHELVAYLLDQHRAALVAHFTPHLTLPSQNEEPEAAPPEAIRQNGTDTAPAALTVDARADWAALARFAPTMEQRNGASAEQCTVQQPTQQSGRRQDDIAIIGLCGRYPMAATLDELWANLLAGRNCITAAPAERFRHVDNRQVTQSPLYGGFLEGIDQIDHHLFGIPAEQVAQLAPEGRLLLETVWATLEDGGYPIPRLNQVQQAQGVGVGVFVGAMYNQYAHTLTTAQAARLQSNSTEWQLANRVSHFFNLTGPSLTVNTACASSLTAVHLACSALRNGDACMAVAGGVNLTLDPAKYQMLTQSGFLGQGGESKSFGVGDGYIPGEGVGMVLLKPLAAAQRDGDRIYGVIKGSFVNHGGGRQSYMAPDPKQQEQLILHTLARSGVEPTTISYVEAAANGSPLGDPLEVIALTKAFGRSTKQRQFCAIGSVKSNLGHLEASSGIAQLTKVLLQLKYKTLVPSINADPVNPAIDFTATPFYLQAQVTPWSPQVQSPDGTALPRRALINSLGAGGVYAGLVVEESPVEQPTAPRVKQRPPDAVLLPFSAQSGWSLQHYLAEIIALLRRQPEMDLVDLALTLQLHRNHLPNRLALVATSIPELAAKLASITWQDGAPVGAGIYVTPLPQQLGAAKITQAAIDQVVADRDWATLAQAWVGGHALPWQTLAADTPYQMVELPVYVFDHRQGFGQSANGVAPPAEVLGKQRFATNDFDAQLYQTLLAGLQQGTLTPERALAFVNGHE